MMETIHTKIKSILQIFEDIYNQIVEEVFKVFDNYKLHEVLICNKLDYFLIF